MVAVVVVVLAMWLSRHSRLRPQRGPHVISNCSHRDLPTCSCCCLRVVVVVVVVVVVDVCVVVVVLVVADVLRLVVGLVFALLWCCPLKGLDHSWFPLSSHRPT